MTRIRETAFRLGQYESARRGLRVLGEAAREGIADPNFPAKLQGLTVEQQEDDSLMVRAFGLSVRLEPGVPPKDRNGWIVRGWLLNPNRPPDSSRKFLNKLLIADSGAVSGLSVEANVHAPGGALEVVCFFLEVALVLDRPD